MANEVAIPEEKRVLSKEAEKDFQSARETYNTLIQTGSDTLESLAALAEESEHPRTYEVLGTMIKNVSDVTGKLMELHKMREDIINTAKGKAVAAQQPEGSNTVLITTTAELQKMLADKVAAREEKVVSNNDV
jgi:hypothetical protein